MEHGRRPGAFSPKFTSSSPPSPPPPALRDRSFSVDSDSSASSQTTNMSQSGKRGPTPTQGRSAVYTSPRSNTSTPVLQNYSRPTIAHVVSDNPARRNSPLNPTNDRSHKRNNSQGFFEPSLPTLTDSPPALTGVMPTLTPSQIAAQAAMQAQSASSSHFRRRSLTTPSPGPGPDPNNAKATIGQAKHMPQSNSQSQNQGQMLPPGSRKGSTSAASNLSPNTGLFGPPGAAAASAASAAYPGAVQLSPGLTSFSSSMTDLTTAAERAPKSKAERAKQIFSKSKQIAVANPKDLDRRDRSGPVTAKLPSPGNSLFPVRSNASTTSLTDTISTVTPSLYGGANASTSTLVPADRPPIPDMAPPPPPQPQSVPAKEKEVRHRTGIFSRPKKNREKDDHPLTLSSAASNSKPVDPSLPQSIYSFAPSSPAPSQMGFVKSAHATKKKKDEFDFSSAFGPATTATGHFVAGTPVGYESAAHALQGFGLNHMTPEDAWDFLKAKLLVVFEGEELRIPIEDLNRLVSVHLQRCVQKRTPTLMIEDLRDLLETGFASLDMTLRRIADERLVPQLVEMWEFVFGTVLPYIQAVFLPLDLELRGHGNMTPQEAVEFWGLSADPSDGEADEVDVRKCVLLSFRDGVVLPRHDILKQVFSRLSLESINIFPDSPLPMPPFGAPPSGRPGTAGSLDPTQSSFNSQSSTLISDSSRSRATSNTSAPELPTFSPTMPARPGTGGQGSSAGAGSGGPPDSSQVTETVGRMLQCMSMLVSVHSGDESQEKMEDLTKTLKLNWLGRGRTGRNRKGLVGARVPRRATPVMG